MKEGNFIELLFLILLFPEFESIAEDIHILRKALFDPTPSVMSLQNIPMTHDRIKAFVWILNNEKSKLSSLIMTGQDDFSKIIGIDGLDWILKRNCFDELHDLVLGGCMLDFVPDLKHLTFLKTLDISHNHLTTVETITHPGLEQVKIQDNPVETVTTEPENLPKLNYIYLGSSVTKFICGYLLEKATESSFKLEVVPKHVQNLIVPFPNVFIPDREGNYTDRLSSSRFSFSSVSNVSSTGRSQITSIVGKSPNKIASKVHRMSRSVSRSLSTTSLRSSTRGHRRANTMRRYLQRIKIRLDLSHVPDLEERYKAFMFILQEVNVAKDVYELYLSNQENFCQWLGQERLNLFLTQPGLSKIHSLFLSNCQISDVPGISHMEKLRLLDISYNPISSIGEKLKENTSIETLYLRGTNIETIHFDFSIMTCLKNIEFGSESTKFISRDVLNKKTDGTVNVVVVDHGQSLIYPNFQTFENPDLLKAFLKNKQIKFTPSEIVDPNQRYEVLRWLIDQEYMDSLDLSNQVDLFEVIDQNGGIDSLLALPKLQRLLSLNMAGVGLTTLPDVSSLVLLQDLDLSHNLISDVHSLTHNNLKSIVIHNNRFECLNFNPLNLPELQNAIFGSVSTRFVSFAILEKSCAGDVHLGVIDEYQERLVLPSYNILHGNPEDLFSYVHSDEINLNNISDERDRQCALFWMLKNKQKDVRVLDCSYTKYDGTQSILTDYPYLENVRIVCMKGCGLSTFPEIKSLSDIEVLDISDNNIHSVPENIRSNSLQNLNVSTNPIVAFNTDFSSFAALQKISIGSSKTKYIVPNLLQRMTTGLDVAIDKSAMSSLVYPPRDVVGNKKDLRDLVEKRVFSLKGIDYLRKFDCFNWFLNESATQFNSLDLSFEKKFLTENQIDLDACFTMVSLHALKELYLEKCGLDSIPNVSGMPQLKLINVRNNRIKWVKNLPRSVRKLFLEDNPIQCLSVDLDTVPDLAEISCGSTETHYISHALIKKVVSRELVIMVPETYQEHFFLPPSAALNSYEHLTVYASHPEKYLGNIHLENRSLALNWLVNESKFDIACLDFTFQYWLFPYESKCILNGLNLSMVHTLKLNNCGLQQIPNFGNMVSLQTLHLCENNLSSLDTHEPLMSIESLNIAQNMLEEIDIDPKCFPRLRELTLGSTQTKYITIRVLSLVLVGKLSICVPDDYRQYLLLPVWSDIHSGVERIKDYVDNTVLSVSHITDYEKRRKAIEWLLNKKEKTFTSVDLSHQGEFCHQIGVRKLSELFQHPALNYVRDISLSERGLNSVPSWETMSSLIEVDLSGNKIESIPESKTVRKLDVSRTKFTKLIFFKNKCPDLIEIKAGSRDLEYISFDLLKRASVKVSDDYTDSLIMPPWHVISHGDRIERYLTQPERYFTHVSTSKLPGAIRWLAYEADFEFSTLDLSQKEESLGLSTSEIFMILKGNNVKMINKLDMSYCGLNNWPELECLEQLERLVVVGNDLADVSALRHKGLKMLDISLNPAGTVDVNLCQCPNVTEIRFGSENTNYISIEVLQKVSAGDLNIFVDSTYKERVIIPPPNINLQKDKVKEYLDSGKFNVSWYVPEKQRSPDNFSIKLLNVLAKDKRKIVSFEMINQCDLASIIGANLDDIMKCSSLENLEELIIRDCGIKQVPCFQHFSQQKYVDLSGNLIPNMNEIQDALNESRSSALSYINLSNTSLKTLPKLAHLKNLTTLDISNNNLNSIQSLESPSLRTLNVTGNEFLSVLDFIPQKVQALNEVIFGSVMCKFIRHSILEKASTGALKLNVLNDYRENLLVPRPCVLFDDAELTKYVTCTEMNIQQINSDEPHTQYEAIEILTEAKDFHYQSFNLSNQRKFCENIGIAQLKSIICRMTTITKLTLSHCNLSQIPDLSGLSQLHVLDLQYNDIKQFDFDPSSQLKKINLKGNPISGFHLDVESLSSLEFLAVGSEKTKYISLYIVERICRGLLEVDIDEKYWGHLVYPTADYFKDKEKIDVLYNEASLVVASIPFGERIDAFAWVLKHSGSLLKSLTLSGIRKDAKGHEREIDDILSIFRREIGNLVNLRYLDISQFEPKCLPDLSTLGNLAVINLSDNNLYDFKEFGLFPDSLQDIDLSKNPIIQLESFKFGVRKLVLRECGITEIPLSINKTNLEELDIGHNNISVIDREFSGPKLKKLVLDRNPIETITLTRQQFPMLSDLVCGSQNTKFLGFDILKMTTESYKVTLSDGQEIDIRLNITIREEFATHLLLPSSHIIFKGSKHTQEYLRSPEVCLKSIDDIEQKVTSLEWLLKNAYSLATFNLDEQADLVYRITFPRLQKMLNHNCLQMVTLLDLSKCGLSLCPNIDRLEKLLTLNLNGNSIRTIDEIEKCRVLEHLFMVGNPVQEMRSETDLFERLKTLHFGSNETKFISHKILNRVSRNELTLFVPDEYRDALLCPLANILFDSRELNIYISKPECIMTHLPHEMKYDAMYWLINRSQCAFQSLDLSNASELFTEGPRGKLHPLDSDGLSNLQHLNLHCCSLKEIPKLARLTVLESLDLSNNFLTGFAEPLQLLHLKDLNLIGNPMDRVEVDTAFLPSLQTLSCGSNHTKCISLPILRRFVASDALTIDVPFQFRSYLILPSFNILDNKKALEEFVNNPEKEIDKIPPDEKENTFLWLLDQRKSLDSLNLSGQIDICADIDKLNSLLSQLKLRNIEALHLDSCKLSSLPQLTYFTKLWELHVENNNMTEIEFEKLPTCLESIYMNGNAIEIVWFDLKVFTCLKHIICGSNHTKYISFDLIQAILDLKLEVKIEKLHQGNFFLPPFHILKDKTKLAEYVVQPELELSSISNMKDKRDSLDWLLRRENKRFDTSFSLSGERDLCAHLGNIELQKYLGVQGLHSVKELHLDDCGLTNVPDVSSLSHLKCLNLRNNEIRDIETSLNKCNLNNVEEIHLTGNPFITLDFDVAKVLPSLKMLTFGSKSTTYIRLSLLDTLVIMKVDLILEEGTDEIIFPPYEYLKGESDNLAQLTELCKKPEKILTFLKSVDKKYIWLKWLLDDATYTVKSLDLSGETELVNYHSSKILNHSKLSSIEKLILNNCNLAECPNITLYPQLKYLDLGNNLFTEWCSQPKHERLEQLRLSGNQIPVIMNEFNCFPALRKLTIGSEKTEYIDMGLLKRMTSGDKLNTDSSRQTEVNLQTLLIKIDRDRSKGELYWSKLKCPPYSVFKNKTISEYIKSPEIFLSQIRDIKERSEALEWLIENYGQKFRSFNLTDQKQLCVGLGMSGLEHLFQKLQNLEHLNISNCGLTTLPDIGCFQKIESLDLSSNNIDNFSATFQHDTLKKLYIEGNLIEVVDLEYFPSVMFLSCGSKRTWRISPSTLRKVANDKLKIEVTPESQSELEFPPYEVLKHGPAAVSSYIDKEELDLSAIKGDDVSTFGQLVDNAEKPIKSIRLSNVQHLTNLLQKNEFKTLLDSDKLRQNVNSLFIDNCQIEEYPKEIRLPNLRHVDMSNNVLNNNFENIPSSVISLKIQNCKISDLPNVTQLETLDARDNNIKSLEIGFKFSLLKKLLFEGNPAETVSLDRRSFPVLESLSCGSASTHFISHSVVELHQRKELSITIPPTDLRYLYLPPGELINSAKIGKYITSPEMFLDDVTNKEESLTWLMQDMKEGIKVFNMSGQWWMFETLKMEGLQGLLNNSKLGDLESLYLDRCDLTTIPKIDHLSKLNVLGLSDNNIKTIHWGFKNSNLKILYFHGNPVERIDISSQNFPSLTQISCGSQVTKELTPDVLQQVIDNKITVTIPEKYRESLRSPPYGTLSGEKSGLRGYLSGELDLSVSSFRKSTFQTIKTVINNHGVDIKSLKLSGQSVLFKPNQSVKSLLDWPQVQEIETLSLDRCKLREIPEVKHLRQLKHLDLSYNSVENTSLSMKLKLPNLTKLSLRHCGLDHLPSLAHLPNLKELDFSENKMKATTEDQYYMKIFNETFNNPHPLEVLDLSGNLIEEIHVNTNSFTSLRRLLCGSEKTHFISFHLLAASSRGNIITVVIDKYKDNLLIPSATMLDDPRGSLQKLLKDKTIDLKRIPNVQQRFLAIDWLFTQKKDFTSLRLSGQNEFCKVKTFEKFLKHPSLQDIDTLYLDNCGLEKMPFSKNYLPNLKQLDISRNQLSDIFGTFSSHKKLEKIYVDGNPISTIRVHKIKEKFPMLKYIQAGSEYTHYIDMPLLEAVAKQELAIDITSDFRKQLNFPPYEVLSGGADSLKIYIKEITSSKKSKTEVWKSTTENILMFLGSPEAGKTSLKRTLKENTPKPTKESDRTVILERDVVSLGDNISIQTLDFGGHDIYELEYPIFLRGQNIIALIVVDLTIYGKSNHEELVTKWMHNCVLCADCKVIFVPTKMEQVASPDEVNKKVESMRLRIKEWIDGEITFLEETKEYLSNKQSKDHKRLGQNTFVKKTKDLDNVQKSLEYFQKFQIVIIPTSSVQMNGLNELKSRIRGLVDNGQVNLPANWDKVLKLVTSEKEQQRYHISLSEIETCIVDDLAGQKKVGDQIKDKVRKITSDYDPNAKIYSSIEECLKYLSKKGIILWYSENKEYIYHRIDNILELHKELFRHDLEDSMQYKIEYGHIIENEVTFDLYKGQFLRTGLLSRDLLQCLWLGCKLNESELEGMIELVKANNHCFEDTADGDKIEVQRHTSLLRFPWFINIPQLDASFWEVDWTDKVPSGYLEFQYVYVFFKRIPSTLYQRISVRLQTIIPDEYCNYRRDWADGVYVQMGNNKLLIQKQKGEGGNPRIVVQLRAPATDVSQLWKLAINSYNKVVNILVDGNIVVTFNKVFVCPHCILARRPFSEAYKVQLGDVMQSNCSTAGEQFCPKADIVGQTHRALPAALLLPISSGEQQLYVLTRKLKKQIKRFIRRIKGTVNSFVIQ